MKLPRGAPDQAEDGLVECLICGVRWRSLGHHVVRAHRISADEYRDRHGILRGQPLTSTASRQRWVDSIRREIASGTLDSHYAGNAARGVVPRANSARVMRELRAQGAPWKPARQPRPWAVLAAIVMAIEGGATRAQALLDASVSQSAFYAGVALHPDLKARLVALRRQRPS